MTARHDPDKRHRRSIRLKGYDYTREGAYFITIVAHNRHCLFGVVEDGRVRLNASGQIVFDEWFKTPMVRSNVRLNDDEFVVMPNHVHGILWIMDDDVGARRRRAPTVEQFGQPISGSVPTIIRAFKSIVCRRINELCGTPGASVWQRNYHEHIIRNETALNRIRRYIAENPARWAEDAEHPDIGGIGGGNK